MNSIRNKDGLWINSNVFREEAIHYEKYGFYCPDPYLSYGWKEYWDEQRRRCLEGYEVGGVKITGNHYAYLNFCEIYDKSAGQSKFPDFWDGDFDFFWFLDIARYGIKESELKKLHLEATPTHLEGNRHFMMAKCRQRGFTWKLASIASNTFNHLRKTQTLLGAYDKGYLYKGGVWDRTLECLNFVNTHTGWKFGKAKSDSAYQRKGFVEYVDGIPVEGGFQSELFAVTFHQTASAARGKVPYYVIFEEAGEWPGLDSAYMATRPGCEEGGKLTGQIIVGGTGGDMSKASIPFSDMFYNPDAYNLLAFENIWDDDSGEGKCAFFFPENLCNKSFMDDIGNSFMEEAKEFELEERKKLMVASGGTVSMAKRLSEHPLKPSEAFLVDSVNDFPVELLQAQLSKIRSSEKLSRLGKVYELKYLENKIVAEPDLKGKKTPLVHYRQKSLDQSGAVVIYELPPPNPPPGLYFIGYDPYRHDKSQTDSLGSCYVWKGYQEYSATGDTIVAEYVGRPKTTDDCDEIILRLAKLYNAQVMYENEVLNTKTYFTYNNALDFLALEPSNIISSIVPNSKVDRKFGVHMSPKIKEACEKYAKRWLLTPRGTREDGTKILNLHVLYSIGLLEELIKYNRTDNFDRVMSFFMVMIAIQDNDSKSRETQSRESKVIDQLLNMSKYKK
jgi:hypothetical protein